MNDVRPRLETLPRAQQELWTHLSQVGPQFVLCGGTASSLRVGGRTSVDFDFFTPDPLDHNGLSSRLRFLKGAHLLHSAHDTATFAVGHGSDVVAVSFFASIGIGRVDESVRFSDNGLFAAGLLDLGAQNLKVVQQRAEAKDYMDIHKLISVGISLAMALAAARAPYPEFNPAISSKALSYFGDVESLSPEIQRDIGAAASRVRDLPGVPKLSDSLLPNGGVP